MAADKNEYQNAGDYTLDGVLIVGSPGEKINSGAAEQCAKLCHVQWFRQISMTFLAR